MSPDGPSSSQSTAPSQEQEPGQGQQQSINNAYTSFKHNAALAFLIGAPVLIAIPPRKLDLYTFSLAGAFITSANHLTRERTGRNIIQQFGYEYIQRQKTEQTHRMASMENGASKQRFETGVREKITGTGTGAMDWKQKRLREEQEKLDNGEGYADMIVDQIWDVWNQKKDDDGGGGDGSETGK